MKQTRNYYSIFIFARFAGLVSKPLFLFLLTYFSFHEASLNYAKLIICLVSVYSIFKLPVHIDFYRNEFAESGDKKSSIKLTQDKYIFRVFNITFSLLPLIFIFCSIIFLDIFYGVLVALILLSEKLYDEVSRFQQYKKYFLTWSVLFLAKTYLPFIATVVLGLMINTNHIFTIFLINTIVFNIILTLTLSHFKLNTKVKYFYKTGLSFFITFRKIINEQGLRYVFLVLSAFFFQIDRLFVTLIYESQNLTELTAMAQIFNLMPIAIGYIYIHNNKAAFTRNNKDFLVQIFQLRIFFIMFLFMILSSLVIFYQYFYFSWNNYLDIQYVLFYLLAFSILAFDLIYNEYQMWNEEPKNLVFIESVALIVFFTIGFLLGVNYVTFAFFIASLVKLLMHIALSKKSSNPTTSL